MYSEGKESHTLAQIAVKNGYVFGKVTFLVSFHFLVYSLMGKASFADNAKYRRGEGKSRMCQQSSEESENMDTCKKERSPRRLLGLVGRLQRAWGCARMEAESPPTRKNGGSQHIQERSSDGVRDQGSLGIWEATVAMENKSYISIIMQGDSLQLSC